MDVRSILYTRGVLKRGRRPLDHSFLGLIVEEQGHEYLVARLSLFGLTDLVSPGFTPFHS